MQLQTMQCNKTETICKIAQTQKYEQISLIYFWMSKAWPEI